MGARGPEHRWTNVDIALLTQLWSEGHTGSEIGRRMHMSKSMIIAKARRLALPGRGTPLGSTNINFTVARVAERKRTLTLRAQGKEPVATRKPGNWSQNDSNRKRAQLPTRQAPHPITLSKTKVCQNLSGDRPHGGWTEAQKCGQPAIEGKPWCPGCAAEFIARNIPASQLISEAV